MNQYVYNYVRDVMGQISVGAEDRILEVGSLNVNGSVRGLFTKARQYIGSDLQRGADVDVQMKANHLAFPDALFDVLVCCEMLEHDNRPWESIQEFAIVLKPEGALILTTRGIGFEKHGYPNDYWRFTGEGLAEMISYRGRFQVLDVRESHEDQGVFATAARR